MRPVRSIPLIVAIVACATGLVASILSPVLSRSAPAGIEESLGLGMLYALRGTVEPQANVIVVALSRESADRLGFAEDLDDGKELTGWPRYLHAELLGALQRAGVRAVVFDVHFKDPDEETGDHAFADAIEAFGDVLLFEEHDRSESPADDRQAGMAYRTISDSAIPPWPLFDAAARSSAPFSLPIDGDDVNRYGTFIESLGNTPTLPVVSYALIAESSHRKLLDYLNVRRPDLALDPGSEDLQALMARVRRLAISEPGLFADFDPAGDSRAARLRDLYAGPGYAHINYYGPPRSIRTVPAHEILLDGPDPTLRWQGAIVLVGYSERTQSDQQDEFNSYYTDQSALMLSGVEIAGTALSNLIEDRPLQALSLPAQLGIVIVIGLLIGVMFRLRSTAAVLIGLMLSLLAYVLLARAAFSEAAVWLPVVVPLLVQVPVALIGGLLLRHAHAEARRRAVTVGASRFLPHELIARISEDPDAATRDSELVDGICMVTDIEQFTAHSEILSPRQLEGMLNAYYDELFGIVAAHGGLVTDIVGDSMVAVWRMSTAKPMNADAPLAAALVVSSRFSGADSALWRTRTGLHSGAFVLGTVGAEEHLEYRALGDTVNTAARIQGLNKRLGTLALATADVLAATTIEWRQLGCFLLAGKQQALDIGEPLGLRGELGKPQAALKRQFEQALQRFRAGRFDEALESFEAVLQQFPDDGPARFYVDHVRMVLSGNVVADPDGIIHLAG